MKDPVEAIVVITDRGNPGKHQVTGGSRFIAVVVPVKVFPHETAILLIKCEGAWDVESLPLFIRKDGVEQLGVGGTVHPGFERVGIPSHAVFSLVKEVSEEPVGPRICVGYHHLRKRCTVEHRAQTPPVLVSDGIKHQALERVHAETESPVLPSYFIAFERKAWSLRLDDFQGLWRLEEFLRRFSGRGGVRSF